MLFCLSRFGPTRSCGHQLKHAYRSNDIVSQVKPNAFKDAIIGLFFAALVVLAQRGKKRPELCISALVILTQRGKGSPKQTLQRIVLPPLQPQLQQLVSHVRLVLSIGFVQLWRCNNLLMVGVLAARRTARRSTDRCVRLLPVVASHYLVDALIAKT